MVRPVNGCDAPGVMEEPVTAQVERLAARMSALKTIGAILLGALIAGASTAAVVTRYLDRIERLEKTSRWQTRALWQMAQRLDVELAEPPP